MPTMSASRFRKMARKGEAIPAGSVIHKQINLASAPEVLGDRVLRFIASTERVDREFDVVRQNWLLDDFRCNPVILLNHDACHYPIGRAVEIGVVEGALRMAVEFVPADVPEAGPRAEAVFQLVKQGFMAATSVGFQPLEFEFSEDEERSARMGLDFVRNSLCEVSVVCVPANADALYDPPEVAPLSPVGAAPPVVTEPLRAAEAEVVKAAMDAVAATGETDPAVIEAVVEVLAGTTLAVARARRRRAYELLSLG